MCYLHTHGYKSSAKISLSNCASLLATLWNLDAMNKVQGIWSLDNFGNHSCDLKTLTKACINSMLQWLFWNHSFKCMATIWVGNIWGMITLKTLDQRLLHPQSNKKDGLSETASWNFIASLNLSSYSSNWSKKQKKTKQKKSINIISTFKKNKLRRGLLQDLSLAK